MNPYADRCAAYALGYFDGRAHGTEANPYDGADARRAAYDEGYQRGVADYCDLDAHPEEATL